MRAAPTAESEEGIPFDQAMRTLRVNRLHLVTNDDVLLDPGFGERARAALVAGAGQVTFHLRGPGISGRRLWEFGRELNPIARRHEVRLLVNDRVDVALALGASGVHLGARSLPVAKARQILGRDALLGRSVRGRAGALELREELAGAGPSAETVEVETDQGADFVLVGTLFPTPSHPGRTGSGPESIADVARVLSGVPALGIGGVTPPRVRSVLDAGGHGVAVLRAVWKEDDPALAVQAFLRHLDEWAVNLESGQERG